MNGPVHLRGGVLLGEGTPKICVPLTGESLPALLAQAADAKAARADLVEWRADWFAGLADEAATLQALAALRAALEETPILFTIRTTAEGGRFPRGAAYQSLTAAAAQKGADLVDVELDAGPEAVSDVVAAAKAAGVPVVVSRHHFDATPPKEDMAAALRAMRAARADVAKIAVTPRTPADVLALLAAAEEYRSAFGGPLIAISMGALGAVSRVAGGFFGSCLSFGTAGRASAPGQLSAQDLRTVLEILHRPGGETE